LKTAPKAILAASENVYPEQRDFVEDVFKCRYYSAYGQSEKVIMGGECEYSTYYHMFPQYGYLELIDSDGKSVLEEDSVGEIVGTGFLNYAMPFIRYRTGDMGVYSKEECKCGRQFPIIKRIEGRLQEYLIAVNHNLISYTSINFHSDIFDNVKRYQYFQEKVGDVVLKIEKGKYYSENDTNKILLEHEKKFKGQMKLELLFVPQIELTKRGKYKVIDQKLNVEEYL
jgi:phenylacetate-CoA ligase